MNTGTIVSVVGPVVDVEFPTALPAIHNALSVECTVQNKPMHVTLEVQQHLGHVVRLRRAAGDVDDRQAGG